MASKKRDQLATAAGAFEVDGFEDEPLDDVDAAAEESFFDEDEDEDEDEDDAESLELLDGESDL